mmetsp:Transcript_36196/g.91094  ORF Transcript_36196/g.91094 Transcript_36196/m.91094 type:complete len:219 (+) Transcript_36196:1246-1902(+)
MEVCFLEEFGFAHVDLNLPSLSLIFKLYEHPNLAVEIWAGLQPLQADETAGHIWLVIVREVVQAMVAPTVATAAKRATSEARTAAEACTVVAAPAKAGSAAGDACFAEQPAKAARPLDTNPSSPRVGLGGVHGPGAGTVKRCCLAILLRLESLPGFVHASLASGLGVIHSGGRTGMASTCLRSLCDPRPCALNRRRLPGLLLLEGLLRAIHGVTVCRH